MFSGVNFMRHSEFISESTHAQIIRVVGFEEMLKQVQHDGEGTC